MFGTFFEIFNILYILSDMYPGTNTTVKHTTINMWERFNVLLTQSDPTYPEKQINTPQ